MIKENTEKPVIVTGLSGAGLSSVLKSLEDLGFEVFDNFPLTLINGLIDQTKDTSKLAIGIDTRTRGFAPEAVISAVKDINAYLVTITCDDDILHQRFTETRRRHPMAKDKTVKDGIEKERKILKPIEAKADLALDTSALSIHDLRHILEGHFGSRLGESREKTLAINLMSFGFRNGLPREADIVMDVRFLKNPHWDDDLRPLTGLDEKVGTYIEKDEDFESFIQNFQTLIAPLIPRYTLEGKHYLTIAFGCTGGHHRSVYCAERMANWLKAKNHTINITHRDLKST